MRRVVACVVVLLAMGKTFAAQEEKPDRAFRWMLGGYVALQMGDVYLTQRGTSMGLTEQNPVFGTGDSVVTAKLALVPLTSWGLIRLHKSHPKLARGLAVGLDAVYLGVAASNLRAINEAD